MPSLQIRKLPNSIYQALKSAAALERRSLSQQAIIALAKGLGVSADFRKRRKKILTKIQNEQQLWKKWAKIDIASWVREDRDGR